MSKLAWRPHLSSATGRAVMAVTVKHIDRNAIGHDQDWEGNNAAFTCPVCKKFSS
jgi:hypothetical protein